MRIPTTNTTDPLRPVDWRYRQASELFNSNQGGIYGRVDSSVYHVVQFLHARQACRTKGQRRWLYRRMAKLVDAFAIFEDPDGRMRAEVEARLLAGQSAEEIAAGLVVQPEVIVWFGKIFFDIADRLPARGFVLNKVIPATKRCGDPNADRFALWKRVAYLCGAAALERVMYGVGPSEETISLGEMAKGAAESMETIAQLRAASAVDSMSPDDLKQAAQLQQIAGRAGRGDAENEQSLDKYQENIEAFLKDIPWSKYPKYPRGERDEGDMSPLERYEHAGWLLRAHELEFYGKTGVLPKEEFLASAVYPQKKGEQSR